MAQTNSFVNLTSSGSISTAEFILSGMYVNSTTSGTIRFWHGGSVSSPVNTADNIGGVITPAIGYHNLGDLRTTAGVYVQMGGTARDITFHIKFSD